MSKIITKSTFKKHNYKVKLLNKQLITDSILIITIENPGFEFTSGQHVILSLEDDIYDREYSIYSSENDKHIQLLIKIVDDGYFTQALLKSEIGSVLNLRGPHGIFCPNPLTNSDKTHYLIATGTGIAPFNSYINTYSDLLKFKVIHGVKKIAETKLGEKFSNYFPCVSRENIDNKLGFNGRITEYLKTIDIDDNGIYYLCGNFDMIYDVETHLVNSGINPNSIYKEVYF